MRPTPLHASLACKQAPEHQGTASKDEEPLAELLLAMLHWASSKLHASLGPMPSGIVVH